MPLNLGKKSRAETTPALAAPARNIKNATGNNIKRISVKNNFIIKKNKKKGFGVFAERNYKNGESIWKFGGKSFKPKNIVEAWGDFANPLQIESEIYLHLDKPSIYFNHSCDPNSGFKKGLTLFAIKNIEKGEEITYDYSTTIDESFDCKCGSKKCRGAISDFFSLPKEIIQYYFRKEIVPAFIKRRLLKKYKGICPCGSSKKYKKCHGR